MTLTLPAVAPTTGQVLKAGSTATTLEWAADSATDSTKMPLAGGTFTGDVTFTGDSSNGLWDKSASAFVANLTGNVTGNASGSAATVTGAAQSAITSLGTLTGLTVSGNTTISGNYLDIQDTKKLRLGTDGDCQFHHSGGANFIETGSQIIHIQSDSSIRLQKNTGNENMLVASADGAVELYWGGTGAGKKLDTYQYGVNVTGNITTTSHVYWGDNGEAIFGAGPDLKIYSDGTNAFIKCPDTGNNLTIESDQHLYIKVGDGEDAIKCVNGQAVELYFNNFKTFQTNSAGINLYGPQNGDCVIDMYSDEGDDNADLWRQRAGQGGVFYLQNYAPGSWDTFYSASANGGITLYYDNSPKLYTKSFGVQIEMSPRMDLYGTGNNIELKFITNSGTHRGSVYADNGNTIGFLKAGTSSWAARWHSDGKQTAHGDIVPNADMSQTLGNSSYQWSSIYGQNLISRTNYPLQFYANNNYAGRITTHGEWRFQVGTNSDNNVSTDYVHAMGGSALDSVTSNLARFVLQERVGVWMSFKNGSGTHYGSIYLSNSNVVYGGTSDYRYKENVAPLTGAITTLKLLKPITYTWNELSKFNNTDTHRGFLAHEVQEVEPDAVSGTKDGMTISGNCVDASGETTQINVPETHKKEGETWTKTTEVIDIQQLDERKLVPILTAALQEAVTKIETLETKVAALEAG